MREIIRMRAGSHVFGTSVPKSDEDQKGIFIPSALSILLQQAGETISTQEDIDLELFSLHRYVHLLMGGQTVALDMLFTPEKYYLMEPEPEWYSLMANREKFLCKGVAAFVGYCRTQVSKYALKVDRYMAVASMVALLERLCAEQPGSRGLGYFMHELEKETQQHEYTNFETIGQVSGVQLLHLEVAGTKMPLSASLKNALKVYRTKLTNYGERVKKAGDMDGDDWKSVMHAVRVAHEALEFLKTGVLTFPRPEASLLLAIRLGKIPYERVSSMIEEGLVKVEEALKESTLPEKPNREFANLLVAGIYRDAVIDMYRASRSRS